MYSDTAAKGMCFADQEMLAPGPKQYMLGRTIKVTRLQPGQSVGLLRREVEPTGIEPVTSFQQIRQVDDE
jgi:hypothetical protein